jgi:hypothetical protein
MATDPNDICLSEEDKELLVKVADKNGKPWRSVFWDAITKYAQASSRQEEPWLDTEYMDSCAAEVHAHVSLERMRQILSKVSGSLAEDVIADRTDC